MNSEKDKERTRRWIAANRERKKATDKAWYEAHKQHRSEYHKAYYRKHAEVFRVRTKKWTQENPERRKQWRQSETARAGRERYYEKNLPMLRAASRQWAKDHPEERVIAESRRRARKLGNGGSHTLEEKKAKFALLGNVCYYCWQPKLLTADHDIPIARGGTDNIDNILPACRSCNCKKNKRTSAEFLFRKVLPKVQQKHRWISADMGLNKV